MTSEEQKEEFEDILLEFHRYDISMADAVSRIEAALHSVEAEKEPEWISCDERLPTESDYDVNGNIWLATPLLREVNGVQIYVGQSGCPPQSIDRDSYWMPTGLARPAPPEHKPE